MTIGAVGIYLLEVSTLLILLYIFNKQLLGRETLHRLNRYLWLSTIAACFLLPLCKSALTGHGEVITTTIPQGGGQSTAIIEFAASDSGNVTLSMILIALAVVYLIGVIVVLIHNGVSYSSLLRLIMNRRYDIAQSNDQTDIELLATLRAHQQQMGITRRVRYIIHDRDIAPFSWFNFVVVSRDDITANGQEITLHELSHVAQNHSFDVVLLNILTIILWFNPAAWLTKQALQQVHEYCADHSVLSHGINAKEYQLLLIRKAVGARSYTISNSLNHSNLKNRITMMLKKKSSPLAWAKCLYAIPVAITAIAAFASPAFAASTKAITSAKVTNYFADNKTETPPTNEMQSERILYFMDGMIIKNGNEISPDRIKSISVTKKSSTEEWQNHKAWESCNPDDYDAIIELTLNQAVVSVEQPITVKEIDNALYVINDEVVEKSIFDNLDTNMIQAISVLKGKNNVKIYDNSGKYSGAIVITLKDGETIQSAINTKGTEQQKIRVIDTRMESILE